MLSFGTCWSVVSVEMTVTCVCVYSCAAQTATHSLSVTSVTLVFTFVVVPVLRSMSMAVVSHLRRMTSVVGAYELLNILGCNVMLAASSGVSDNHC